MQMRKRVGRGRREPIVPGEDPLIGCVFVRNTTFFPADSPADSPPEFAPNIVQGKGSDLAHEPSVRYFRELLERTVGSVADAVDLAQLWQRPGPVYGDPRLVPQRLGQHSFQAVVLDGYQRRCAITRAKIRPDVHTLYDRGYLGIDPQHRLLVSHAFARSSETANNSMHERENQSQSHANAGIDPAGSSWSGISTTCMSSISGPSRSHALIPRPPLCCCVRNNFLSRRTNPLWFFATCRL
jgi:hypothetical protein